MARVLYVEKIEPQRMGAGVPPNPADFFPPGTSYEWYDPMDWARQAEYDAALAAYNLANGIANTGAQLATPVLTTAFEVAAGIIALKLVYDHFTKPTKKRKTS